MAQGTKTTTSAQAEQRRKRLAAELRSNLAKRKEQARNRARTGPGRDEHQESDDQGRC